LRFGFVAARFTWGNFRPEKNQRQRTTSIILTGALLSSGGRVRVSAQLVEAPSGALIWSKTSQMAVRDIFQLQDDLVNRIVESLSLLLTGA
jgi:adenylate cyclase